MMEVGWVDGKILFKKHIQANVYHQEKDVSGPNLVSPSLDHRQRLAIVFFQKPAGPVKNVFTQPKTYALGI